MATNDEPPRTSTTVDLISTGTTISKDFPSESLKLLTLFYNGTGVFQIIKPEHNIKDSFSNLIGGVLKVITIERGKISCLLTVKPPTLNGYGGMHGGAVGAVAERLALACARTVVGKDKNLFLGELSISYLSASPRNTEVIVDGSVVKSGRNLTVVAIEFRHKESGRVAFIARATFYNMPIACL
ncbi:Hypothetical predicted protein [Olea europaea subsp. europaea]|uniref:Thioesterase domain-containing protein n=1 Tax=Olea europaea subsp. europaea TaxID=158383 RepID=A0A8S0TEE3_OLEEU|nr:Hypothetical predicted protein [Olea europaea subsp. europaea]